MCQHKIFAFDPDRDPLDDNKKTSINLHDVHMRCKICLIMFPYESPVLNYFENRHLSTFKKVTPFLIDVSSYIVYDIIYHFMTFERETPYLLLFLQTVVVKINCSTTSRNGQSSMFVLYFSYFKPSCLYFNGVY